jgi:hypothetical protein
MGSKWKEVGTNLFLVPDLTRDLCVKEDMDRVINTIAMCII